MNGYMKKTKYILISAISFMVGGYLCWVCIDISMNLNSSSSPTGHEGIAPPYIKGEDSRSLILSAIGGVGGIINGLWYLMHINRTDVFD
jgi:hypothetical protein